MTTITATPTLGHQAQAEFNRRERNRQIRGLLFSSPFWLGFILFTAIPMIASIYFSFTNYSILTVPKWAGLKNYIELPQDPVLLKALINTVVYAGLSVPLSVGLGLLVAILLNQKVRGVATWRTIYYLPSITPVVAYAVLWRWMLSREYGIVNAILAWVGIAPIDWLGNEFWIIVAFVMTGLWSIGGTMIINLAGLQSIPTDLMDAAKVDGAGPASVFRHVTLPMMTPVLFYNVIMGIVGAMQSFSFFYTLTQGNGNTSYTEIGAVYMIYLYRVAFQLYRMGYGSAMAWLLFVIIMGLTLLVVRTSRRWVYYEGEWLTGR
jgi:multiple sugar transport system permease protein